MTEFRSVITRGQVGWRNWLGRNVRKPFTVRETFCTLICSRSDKFIFICQSLSNYTLKCCCSLAQSCLPLCDPMDFCMPGVPVLYYRPEFAKTHVHWVNDATQPSPPLHPLLLSSIFSSIRVSPKESLFTSGGQSVGASASASASVLLVNIHGWFPLGLTGMAFTVYKMRFNKIE